MAWRYKGRAVADPGAPAAYAICDRCGFRYNQDRLHFQYDWCGPRLQNLRLLVCDRCYDRPFEHNRPIVVPPDPLPIRNPRPDLNLLTYLDGLAFALTDTDGATVTDQWGEMLLATGVPLNEEEALPGGEIPD